MTGTIYLGGGGSDDEEANLWIEAFHPGLRVTVWPFARRGLEDRRSAGRWITGALERFNPSHVDVWTTTEARMDGGLGGTDIIAIPGGNTFDLLDTLQSSGLLPALRSFLDRGGLVYGGILMGADIGIARETDPNDPGLQDTTGMGLLGELDVLPHYTGALLGLARSHHARSGRGVLCLPERGGVIVKDGTIRNVHLQLRRKNHCPAHRCRRNSKTCRHHQ
ncbi:dipeptidase E [Arthrobacter silviterrae]|uniref:Type 1 glutamine amidotransferase-like domain-containing protein n=1 Tax=Arthrobacter silviterrae TaxID=2026658 RepID=A0ABX0DCZ1_9MICC|nr:Type 1 glutamine amidotransferase-like domain-containing protein [Arthrobacter silviterrae]MDQ0276590.1 dipeptidase E [Arthrobacter silviterrae]NGN84792.1 type 1 glutamine amidotransferase-like domain-containing protein [Arthrobacter silviterrae]